MEFSTLIDKLPAGLRMRRLFATIRSELTFAQSCPPGHFYSPIPDRAQIEQDAARIFDRAALALPEIDLGEEAQLTLLSQLGSLARTVSLPTQPAGGRRFYLQNSYFEYADAILLATMFLHARPARYIEIGSGFSSALVLDLDEQAGRSETRFTFIDPDDSRLQMLITDGIAKNTSVLKQQVQTVPDNVFEELGEGDILFVDSSHVSKVGSDLNDILFRVLPLLRPGVLIHFHDILWPFEYNQRDVMAGRSWNEAYLLRAYLANNRAYSIELFGSWLERCRPEQWKSAFPDAENAHAEASSLWLRKRATAG